MSFNIENDKIIQPRSKQLEKLSEKNGLRKYIYTIYGDKYKGEWKNNLKDGKGTYLSRTKQQYEGDWKENYRHGYGVLAIPRKEMAKVFILKYRGNWRKGMYKGFGEEHSADGSYYVGYFKNSKKQGKGEMWYADGSFYYGNWKKGGRNGKGVLIESPIEPKGRRYGNRYEGQWKNDMRHGKGRYYHFDTGQKQKGVWRDNICIYSVMVDIYFRQSAVIPSPYPIPMHKLVDINGVCNDREAEALDDEDQICFQQSTESVSKSESVTIEKLEKSSTTNSSTLTNY